MGTGVSRSRSRTITTTTSGATSSNQLTSSVRPTALEKKVLKSRYEIMTNSGATLITEHFNKEPFVSQILCKGVIKKRICSHDNNDSKSFYQTLISWQYGSLSYQLKELFYIISSSSGVNGELLWPILAQTIPGQTNDEYKSIAKAIISRMANCDDSAILSEQQFLGWVGTHIEEDKIQQALKFNITSFDHN